MSSPDLRVVTILNDAYPELRAEIDRISVRSRAERLRFLASYGLACLQGGVRVSGAEPSVPLVVAEVKQQDTISAAPPSSSTAATPETSCFGPSQAPEPKVADTGPSPNFMTKANPSLARLARSLQN